MAERTKGPRRPNHERVLDFMRARKAPVSAYEILDGLRAEGIRAPTTVYRALDQLVKSGKVHRLESINAYLPCHASHEVGTPVFAICDGCGKVEEHVDDGLALNVDALANRLDFAPQHSIIELRGLCGPCQRAGPAPSGDAEKSDGA